MKRLFLATALVGGMIGLSSNHPVIALDKKGDAPVAAKPTKMAPTNLSESECTQLGGKVTSESSGICNSGRFCSTTDESNKRHIVCISKM